ncbi:interleukin-1 family member 10-like [Rhineura floridana]|uniref:interleukin-1 family member 10-like n=1 Tax=Rhineura floridana TaxID=261503 RepID=UPI002AC7FF5C|nr:interleukin-1 family member 10-like [Rhineura floridana]
MDQPPLTIISAVIINLLLFKVKAVTAEETANALNLNQSLRSNGEIRKETEMLKVKPHNVTMDKEMQDLFNHFPKPKPKPDHSKPSTDPEFGIASLPTPWLYRIWDVNQKFLFLMNNMLVAAPQNPSNSEHLLSVTPNRGIEQKDEKIYPIFMGNEDGTHTLSCVESGGGQPQLKLVEERIMGLYEKKEELKSFTFFCKGGSSNELGTFESAAFPGWFMSTSSEPNKPIGLSRQGGAEITQFYFEKK